jgi:hypothetical protein
VPKLAPQQQKIPIHHKKVERVNIDEKIEYAQSVFLNARMSHIKNGIGYKSGDKHNLRIYTNNKEFIKFTKGNTYQDKKQILNNTNHTSYANASYVSHMSYHDFGASYVLMRNNFGKDVEGPEKATRGGGGEWESIKIPRRILAYILESTGCPSLLTRSRPLSYRQAIGPRNQARNYSENKERC